MDLFTFSKKAAVLFCFLLISIFQVADATAIQSTGAGGVWNNTASWLPAQVPVAGDIVTINSGSPITVTAAAACATITINSGGLLTLNGGSITISTSFAENGTLNCLTGFNVLGAGSFTLANNNNAFLMIGDANGITTSPTASGSIQNTGSRTFPATANYVYDGTVNQATGNGLPTTINGGGSLTINNTGAAPNNVVTLATNSTIQNITLQAGILSLNGETITVNGTILNTGGNLATTTGGADGGTFNIQGATLTGPTTFYNLSCNSSNSTITTSGLSAPLINGTLLINARFSGTNSPRYATGSTLSYAGTANNRGLEWNADLTTAPTIGVTQGYPDNVFINTGSDFDICNYALNGNVGAIPRGLNGNLTTSELTMLDWINYFTVGPYYYNPLLIQTGSFTVGGNMIVNAGGNINMSRAGAVTNGAFIIKGSLTINGAAANVDLDSMTTPFTVGNGIILNNGVINVGYTGVASNLQVTGDIVQNGGSINDVSGVMSLTGNWTQTGGTFTATGGTVSFNSTTGNQTITTNAAGGETFYNLTINNTAGNVILANNINVNNQLTFTKGLIVTNANTVSVASSGSIIGAAQSTGWVDGNLQEDISATTPYLFTVGDATTYAPATLAFSSVTTPGNITVSSSTPFTSTPGLSSFALSQTAYANRYWTLTENSGTFGNYTGAFNYGTTSLTGGATIGTLETGVYNGATWTYPSSSGAGTTVTASGIVPLGGSPTSVALAICAPPTIYNVTGTGSYCVGGTPVGLNNSQTGINYQLQTAGPTNVGSPVAGTGAAISFGNQTVGTYAVLATNTATSCTSNMAGSAVITISGAPSIVTPPTTQSVCFSSSTQNAALSYNTPVNAPTNYTITWNPAALAAGFTNTASTPLPPVGTDIQIPVPAGIISNTYSGTIIVTNAGGCTSAGNTFTLTVNPLPTISGLASGSVCFSASAQNYNLAYTRTTSAPTTYSITWNVPTSLINVAATPLPLSPIQISIPANASAMNNTGTIYVTNANGCTSTGNVVTLGINALPTPTFTSEPGTSACLNTAVIYATQSGQTNYAWTIPGTAGVDYTIVSGGSGSDYTTTLKWLTAGSKVISINYTNTNNCAAASPVSSTTTTISAGVNASNLTIPSATPVCAGVNNSTVTVNSTTLPSNTYTVTYNLGAPNTATGLTATMTFTTGTGSFIIPAMYLNTAGSTSITITDLQNGTCNTSGLSATGSISVNAVNPTFIAEPGATACIDSNLIYTTQPGQSNYVWSFSGTANSDYSIVSGGTSTDNSVTLQWLNTNDNKTVTVNYTNTNSCTATSATSSTPTKINICNILPLYIPSGFAPNGQNPIWHIINSEDYPNMQVQIFDRWGHKVFECTGYTAWDGTFQGQNLSTGSYAYVINVNDDRYKQILRGTVTIIR
jgi:gliding motility-associated-like protein